MRTRLTLGALGAALMLIGCSEPPAAPVDEMMLAQQAQVIAADVAATTGAYHEGWIRRLLEALRDTEDPEALAFLEQAREYRRQAHEAFEAGDLAAAREFHRLAFRAVLSAVIEVFPDAAARTGAAVDQILDRIEQRLGDRDAPRIRRVLAHVRELREEADAALEAGDPVTALALNLRGFQILHRLVNHLRNRTDDRPDPVADAEMHAVSY